MATSPKILVELRISGKENTEGSVWPSKPSVSTPLETWERQRGYVRSAHEISAIEQNLQILWERVLTWRRLSHKNILSFRGVDMTLFHIALVYDWGQNGDINQYIASHPHASRPSLVRKTRVTAATTTHY